MTYSGQSLVVSWTEPEDNGSTITNYVVEFGHDGTNFNEITSICDGSNAAVVSAKSCTFTQSALVTEDATFTFGKQVLVRVKAENSVGLADSHSPVSSGTALIRDVPQAAVTLSVVYVDTYEVDLSWTTLSDTNAGHSSITSYLLEVESTTTAGTWISLQNSLLTTYVYSHLTTGAPSPFSGKTYNFRITPKNIFGDGTVSTVSATTKNEPV